MPDKCEVCGCVPQWGEENGYEAAGYSCLCHECLAWAIDRMNEKDAKRKKAPEEEALTDHHSGRDAELNYIRKK